MSAVLPAPFMVDLATGAPESQPARQLFHTPPSLAPLPPTLVHNATHGGHGFGTNLQGTTSDLCLEQFHAWLLVNTKSTKP